MQNDFLKQFIEWMGESKAHLKGHFLLSSGLHSADYIQCALFLADPVRAQAAGEELAKNIAVFEPELIVSAAMGGLFVGHEVAKALGLRHIFCERVDGNMTLKRFADPGAVKFVILEDVFTTGKSTLETAAAMDEASGGAAVWAGAAALIDRSGKGENLLLVPSTSLWPVTFDAFKSQECPCCKAAMPLVKPGSRPSAALRSGN